MKNPSRNKSNSNKLEIEILKNTVELNSDSEIIANRIINYLIKQTIQKSRLNDLDNLTTKYLLHKIFEMTSLFGFLGSIKSDIDTDSKIQPRTKDEIEREFFIPEIDPPKIDSLCYNKMKIIKANDKEIIIKDYLNKNDYMKELEKFQLIIDKDKERELKNIEKELKKQKGIKDLAKKKNMKNKKLESFNEKFIKELKAQLLPINNGQSLNLKNKTFFSEMFSNLNNLTSENGLSNMNGTNKNLLNKTKLFQNSFDEKVNINNTNNSFNKSGTALHKISTLITNKLTHGHKNDLTDFFDQYALPSESLEEIKEENEEILSKENYLRNYFKDKEIEISKKRIEEKKGEKILKEEAKKRKELIEEMSKRPFVFDMDGNIINVISPDPEKLNNLTTVMAKIKRDAGYDEFCDHRYDANEEFNDNNLIFETELGDVEVIEEDHKRGKKFGNKIKNNENSIILKENKKDEKNNYLPKNEIATKRNLDTISNKLETKNTIPNSNGKVTSSNNNQIQSKSNNLLQTKSTTNKQEMAIRNNNDIKRTSKIGDTKNNFNSSQRNERTDTQSSLANNLRAKKLKENLIKKKKNILDEIKEDEVNISSSQESKNQVQTSINYDLQNENNKFQNVKNKNPQTHAQTVKTNEPNYKKNSERVSNNKGSELNKNNNHSKQNEEKEEDSHSSISSIDTKEAERRAKIKYYQPNPLNSHNILPGVSLEIYGMKKEGGPYPSVPNKLTFKEFNELLFIYKPELVKKKPKPTVKDLYKIYESNINVLSDSKMDNNSKIKAGTLKNQFSHYNSRLEEDLILKCADLQEQLFVYEEELKNIRKSSINLKNVKEDNPLKSISKSPKLLSNKVDINKYKEKIIIKDKRKNFNLVKVIKDFKYEDINEFDDEEVYDFKKKANNSNAYLEMLKKNDELMSKNNQKDSHNKNLMVSPVNKHVPYEKELGHMKKYPRERYAKEILAISGKISLEKFPNKNNNLRRSIISGSQFGSSSSNFFSAQMNKENNNKKNFDNDNKNQDTFIKSNITQENFYKNAIKNKK